MRALAETTDAASQKRMLRVLWRISRPMLPNEKSICIQMSRRTSNATSAENPACRFTRQTEPRIFTGISKIVGSLLDSWRWDWTRRECAGIHSSASVRLGCVVSAAWRTSTTSGWRTMPQTMSELYSHLHERIELRLEEAQRVGYGFALPQVDAPKIDVAPIAPNFSPEEEIEVAA